MNKQGVKFFLLYTLACQLQKQANFLFSLVGEGYSTHQHQENERTLAAPGDAAQEQGSVNPEADIPLADRAGSREPDGPPAHWLNRVQQADPEFRTGHGLSAHRNAPQIPPLSPRPAEISIRHTSDRSGMPSVKTPVSTLPDVAPGKLDQAMWRQSEIHNLENSFEMAEEEGWEPTFAMSEGEYVTGNVEADREGNTFTGEYVAGNSGEDFAGNALTMDLFTMHGAQIGRERRVPSLHAGRPEARPISPGEAAQWAASASLPRKFPRVETEASFVSKGDAGIVGATRAVGIARVADVTRPAKIVGTTGLADDAQAGGLAGITGDAGIVGIAGAARTAGIAEGEGIAEEMVAAIPASPAGTMKFAGTVTAQILEKGEARKERLEQNESRHQTVNHPGNLAVHPQRGDQQSRQPLLTRKRQASPDTIHPAFMQPTEPALESLVKPEARQSAAAAQQPGMASPTAHTPQVRWPDLPVLSPEQSQPASHASQNLWPALDVSPATNIYRGPDGPDEQRPAETRWPSLPDETRQTGYASQALTRQVWERQQRLDNEQRGNTWNA